MMPTTEVTGKLIVLVFVPMLMGKRKTSAKNTQEKHSTPYALVM